MTDEGREKDLNKGKPYAQVGGNGLGGGGGYKGRRRSIRCARRYGRESRRGTRELTCSMRRRKWHLYECWCVESMSGRCRSRCKGKTKIDTKSGAIGKFVTRVWTKIRVYSTTKRFRLAILGNIVKEHRVRRFVLEQRRR